MSEFSTFLMLSHESYGSTSNDESDVKTMDDDVNMDDVMTVEAEFNLFTSLPFVEDAVAISLIAFLGFILNSTILLCYKRSRSSTAVYIKAFAAYDICVLGLAPHFLFEIFTPSISRVIQALKGMLGGFAIMGPLFLALDRFLVVVFPHKFRNYEKYMKIGKIIVFALTLVTVASAETTAAVTGYESRLTGIFFAIFRPILGAQFMTCVVLYAIIIVKIVTSERKMAKHRHVTNQLVFVILLLKCINYI